MNKTRLFSLLCAVLFASMCGSHYTVAAEEIEAKDNSFSESDIITSVGLIQSYSLSTILYQFQPAVKKYIFLQ